MNAQGQLQHDPSRPAPLLAALFVVTLITAAICVNFRRGPAPSQTALVPAQWTTQIVASVATSNVDLRTQVVTNIMSERFLLRDPFGDEHEISPSEFFRPRPGQSQDLIDF